MTPKQVERLEKTLGRVAREQGLDQERLRRWVSFLALCGVLESAVEKGVIDIYYLKGGVAMELRFARAARTTKDFDLGLRGNRAERIRRLSEVLQLRFDEFTFRLKPEQHEMELADTVRVEVAVEYKRAWQTIEVDLGPGEAREVDLVTPAIEGVAEDATTIEVGKWVADGELKAMDSSVTDRAFEAFCLRHSSELNFGLMEPAVATWLIDEYGFATVTTPLRLILQQTVPSFHSVGSLAPLATFCCSGVRKRDAAY